MEEREMKNYVGQVFEIAKLVWGFRIGRFRFSFEIVRSWKGDKPTYKLAA